MKVCPKCKSKNIEMIEDLFIKCKDCKYNELVENDVTPGQKTSQREKARYNPYKSGRKLKKS